MPEDIGTSTGAMESPRPRHGRIAHVAIPARDPITSAVFYEAVFGWTLSAPEGERVSWTLGPRDNARVPFVDALGGLDGAFVADRAASPDGVLLHIYVEDLEGAIREIEARGSEIVTPVHEQGNVRVAEFRDPGGNIVGVMEAG